MLFLFYCFTPVNTLRGSCRIVDSDCKFTASQVSIQQFRDRLYSHLVYCSAQRITEFESTDASLSRQLYCRKRAAGVDYFAADETST